MINLFYKLSNIVSKRVEHHGAPYELFGGFAVINYIVPYFMWSPSSNSNFELLILLRLVAGLMCFLLIIKDYWHDSLTRYLPLYWQATLLYCLPFLTTFMLFDSQGETFWLLNMILAMFLLAVLVDWRSFIMILLLGVSAGYGLFACTSEAKSFFISNDTLYWVIYMCFFSVLIGILFTRRNERIAQERLGAYKIVSTSIAHEMRTPLSAMYISAQGVQKYLPSLLKAYQIAQNNKLEIPKIDPKKLQILLDFPDNLISISRRSISIIDIFLANFGTLEKSSLTIQPISINLLINKSIDEYPFYSEYQRNLIQFDGEKDFTCNANEYLVVHVFYNLIKNSLYQIQVAGKGIIHIRLSQANGYNIVHFTDTATGIKNDEIKKIFEDFYTSTFHGTGIGLAYCKKVMHLLRGDIICRSQFGEFTEFQLFFPVV